MKNEAKWPRYGLASIRRRSRVALAVFGCTLLGLAAMPAGAAGLGLAQPHAEVRVEPAVTEQLSEDGRADFWVVLGQRADLSKASEIADWAQRGQYVYDTLTSTAQTTQAGVTARLDALGVRYESFWITNAVLVRGGNQATLDKVRTLPGVAEIRARDTFSLPDPVKSVSAKVTGLSFTVNPGGRAVPYTTLEALREPPIAGTTPEVVWVGRGCVDTGGDEHLADPAGKVALIIRGLCTFEEKYAGAVAAGAAGVVIYNNIPGPFFGSGITDRGVFGVGISDTDGAHLRQLLDDGDTVTLTWTNNPAPEWGISNIRADQVWSEFGVRGENIVVGSIDTGVAYHHPALVNQYRGDNGDGTFDHNYNWWDPAGVCGGTPPVPCDNNGHGTHTVGTIAGDDGGTNQIGVAPGAKWIAAKGCETNSCSDFAILSSAQFMLAPTDANGQDPRPDLRPHIVNNSWGDPNGAAVNPWFRDALTAWNAAGIFGVFSNGNDGPGCDRTGSPADYADAWGVGAFDMSGSIASFSSRGPGENGQIRPSISAPGVNVRSSLPSGNYGYLSGTSMAAPHMAGAAALLWSAAPDHVGDIGATRQIFNQTAVDVDDTTCGGTPENNNVYGEGRLDAYAAVETALGSEPPPSGASQDVVATVPSEPGEGSLVISVDPGDRVVTLPPVALAPSGDRLATSGGLRPVTVADTRSGTNPGWDASAQVGEFSSGSGSFRGGFLGWSPEVISESGGQDATAGGEVAPGFPSGDGLSVPRTLASAEAGAGVGVAELGAGLSLEIPTTTAAGTYTAVLTLTAI